MFTNLNLAESLECSWLSSTLSGFSCHDWSSALPKWFDKCDKLYELIVTSWRWTKQSSVCPLKMSGLDPVYWCIGQPSKGWMKTKRNYSFPLLSSSPQLNREKSCPVRERKLYCRSGTMQAQEFDNRRTVCSWRCEHLATIDKWCTLLMQLSQSSRWGISRNIVIGALQIDTKDIC